MPNKFLIETALEVGIDNLEKSRNTDPKKLYDEVKEAIKTETSSEIRSLYEKYITLYEASTRTASLRRGELSESIKWKNISDLKEAVRNAGKGLSLADIEGLNQYALAEYARQQSRNVGHQDDAVLTTLKSWFQIYEKIKAETVETQKLGFDAALRDAFLKADKVPFDFEYRENGDTKKATVNLKDNTLIIGARIHALKGERIQIGTLGLDAKRFYIPYTQDLVAQNSSLVLEKSEFLKRYMKDILDGKDIRVDSYLVHVERTGEVSPTLQSSAPAAAPEVRKYDLATCAGYASRELKRYGKTLKELQSALKAKQFYKGDINGKFDQTTLDAVIAFQKTIKDAEYGPDGLVGDETISNLFGIKPQPILSPQKPSLHTPRRTESPATGPGTIPGDTRRTDGAAEPSRRPQSNTPSQPRREGVTEAVPVVLKSLDVAMKNFRKVITDVSQKSGYIFDTPEEIKKSQAAVNESLKPVLSAIQSLEGKKLSAEEKAQYDRAVMEVSRYFSNNIDGVKNRHYRNHDLAFDLAFSLIQDDLKRQNITFKPRPTGDTVLASLERLDPKLHAKLKADLRNGYSLGQILSNPQVRSQYEKVYEKIYGEWENEMQALLKKLKENRPTLASAEGNAALNQIISIMGTTDFWDTKARTRDMLTQTAGMVGSTVAGVGAFMLTPVTGGTSAVVGAAFIGGGFSTLGMIATKGRAGWDKETLTELLVNTASFGIGGYVARTANGFIQTGKAIGIASGFALDATAGLAIGIIGDYARAWSLDTGIDLWPTIRNNLPWALLPIGLGMKGALRARAEHVKDTMDRARTQAKMGDVAGAQATIKQAEPEVTALAEEAKKAVPKEHTQVQSVTQNTQPSVKDASGVEYARRPDGVYKKTPDAGAQWEKIDDIAVPGAIKSQLDQVQAPPATPAKPVSHSAAEGQTHATPEGSHHGAPAHAEGHAPSFIPTSQELDTSLAQVFKGVKTSEHGIDYGPYKIAKHSDGKQVRVTGDGVDFVLPPKKAQEELKKILLSKPAEAAHAIEHQIQEGLKGWKAGLTREYKYEGNTYVFSRPKEGGDLVVTDKKTGRVLSEAEVNQIAKANKIKHMEADTKELVEKFGSEKILTQIGPDTFAFKSWQKWNGEWRWYNFPIKLTSGAARMLSTFTLRQAIVEPAMTLQSFWATITTSNSIKGLAVNASRAVLIKDVNKEVTMGSITSAHAIPLAATFGLTAWGATDFDGKGYHNVINPNEVLGSYLSMFYGGLLLGGIGSHMMTDSKPLTWKIGAEKPGAQVQTNN